MSNTPCYASLAAFDLLSCGVGEILGENVVQANEVSVLACSLMQGSDRPGHTSTWNLPFWLSCLRLAEQGAHGAHASARTSRVLFPVPPQATSGLGAQPGSRTGAELMYPPFNVLLTDVSPSQKKEQVPLPSLCLVSTWRDFVQATHCSPQLHRLFKGSVHVLDLAATILHFCCP